MITKIEAMPIYLPDPTEREVAFGKLAGRKMSLAYRALRNVKKRPIFGQNTDRQGLETKELKIKH
ncbi:MAG: hypothetical protein GTO12_24170 [Proteobacteria bacterium]|nr:hypothetical protein [Pseudomonadota bacterium]